MKKLTPELRSQLAAEYVLGVLGSAARRRFERLMRADKALGDAVQYWEARFAGLTSALKPVEPSTGVWAMIERQTGGAPMADSDSPGFFERAGFWQLLAAAASVAAISLGIALRLGPAPAMPENAYVAVVADAKQKPMWIVTADAKKGMLTLKAIGSHQYPAEQDAELWLVMKDDPRPVSLGMLPRDGKMEMKLKSKMMPMIEHGIMVAVSMEPAGGSPTGQPTGPVVYQAAFVRS
jgi:anti-sigma-K factor RskA